jgi:hypothetical protein
VDAPQAVVPAVVKKAVVVPDVGVLRVEKFVVSVLTV